MYRFRVGEGGALVLQIGQARKRQDYYYEGEKTVDWRDATVEDIAVSDPFRSYPTPLAFHADPIQCAFS